MLPGDRELRSSPSSGYAYVCEIESDARIEQKRGRSCDMDSLKRALKRMFGGGKKGKQEQVPQQRSTPVPTQKHTAATSTTQQPPAAPPKDARRQAGSRSPDATKRVPPTHPLSTGQHQRPQEAVPQNHAAQPGPGPHVNAAGGSEGIEQVRDQRRDTYNLMPNAGATGIGAVESRPVSAVEPDESPAPAPPPKTEEAAEAIHAAPPEAAVAAPAGNIHKMGSRDHEGTSNPPAVPAINTGAVAAPSQQPIARMDDSDKILVDEFDEPPPIKAVRAAPGMSATSGPLEDFPDGEFH
ncbi:hypothetical protein LTR36_009981 [Oleoguttula mirabilis]|uniref:Uncharacterized protein n=1 Tax=Oleoguttula mirabilis TaxID=1507867 RepID=A0AAV9J560_9PEZI|nr:hypothetical protein LTR36_009981 [Oleoguttula mirabilis]